MVVSIRELVNKLFSTTTAALQALQMAQIPSIMDMNVDNDIVRGRFTSSSRNKSRESSILLNTSFMAYYMLQTIQRLRKVSKSVKCLIIAFKKRHNM